MLTENEILSLESQRKYFIENEAQVTYYQWIMSRGTNFTCYVNYLNSLNNEQKIEYIIDDIRTIVYSLHKPIQFTFFYWTILLFMLYKFNFKKPVMKIVLIHFIFRSLGDVFNKLGDLNRMTHYFSNTNSIYREITGNACNYFSITPEMNPLKWFLTRQIGCALWHIGEIVGDWYPLIRTRTLAKGQKMMWYVYITCGLYNLSKIALVILHFTLSPSQLYKNGEFDSNRINKFYFYYWAFQLIIIYSSLIYDFTVYYVLKKNLSRIGKSTSGFIKKFKTISQYRIYISVIISIIFLPIVSITIVMKFYFLFAHGYSELNFSFDEIKISINNVQYYMIFIDQIFLLHSRDEPAYDTSYNKEISLPTLPTSMNNDNSINRNKLNVARFRHRNQDDNENVSLTNNIHYQDDEDYNILECTNKKGEVIIKFNNNNYYNNSIN